MSSRRRGLLVGAALVAAALLVVTGPGLWVRFCGRPVENNALVGRTQRQVTSTYGPPVRESDGYSELGHSAPMRLPDGPIRTLVYEPRGVFHLQGGTLWAWFRHDGGDWVCFESCWFAADVDF